MLLKTLLNSRQVPNSQSSASAFSGTVQVAPQFSCSGKAPQCFYSVPTVKSRSSAATPPPMETKGEKNPAKWALGRRGLIIPPGAARVAGWEPAGKQPRPAATSARRAHHWPRRAPLTRPPHHVVTKPSSGPRRHGGTSPNHPPLHHAGGRAPRADHAAPRRRVIARPRASRHGKKNCEG